MDDGFIAGMLVGMVVILLGTFTVMHANESKCQSENNVADCEWISIPVIQEDDE